MLLAGHPSSCSATGTRLRFKIWCFADGRRLELAGSLISGMSGGYPAADGRSVRWRTLLRSDALHQLDAAGGAVLAGLGLRTVLDLRTQVEAEIAPSALDGLPAQLTHISILTGDLQALPLELDAIYRYMIDECGDTIAEAIKVLGAPGRLPRARALQRGQGPDRHRRRADPGRARGPGRGDRG